MDTQPYANPGQSPQPQTPYHQPYNALPQPVQAAESDKSYVAAWLFSYFFGQLGVDRFYRGYIGLGIAKLLTFGGLGVWAFIDFLMTAYGKPTDSKGLPLSGRATHKKMVGILTAVMIGLNLLVVPGLILLLVFLSVPALQKNTRDTSRANDVSAIAVALNAYSANHEGGLPSYTGTGNTTNTLLLCSDESCTDSSLATLAYYSATSVNFGALSDATDPTTTAIQVLASASCEGSTPVADERNIAIVYAVEGGGTQARCVSVY